MTEQEPTQTRDILSLALQKLDGLTAITSATAADVRGLSARVDRLGSTVESHGKTISALRLKLAESAKVQSVNVRIALGVVAAAVLSLAGVGPERLSAFVSGLFGK